MTEVERARDAAMVVIAKAVTVLLGEGPLAQEVRAAGVRLEVTSANQYASDQNDVRRSMGLAECKTPDEDEPLTPDA